MTVIIIVFVGTLIWLVFTPQGRAHMAKAQVKNREKKNRSIAHGRIGHREVFSDIVHDGHCPNCGGSQFTAKRSMKGKVAVGILAPKTQVRCVACGSMFKRG
jgi:hypothetical protein